MAAKQITQKTFDDVVKENIREFEMSAEEALADTIEQFESQGVNLGMIVKDASLYTLEGDHPVIMAVKNLSQALEESPPTLQDVEFNLIKLREECDIDLSRRCLAGSNAGYPTLYRTLILFKEDSMKLSLVLASFCSLTNGQPDLIDYDGKEVLISLLGKYSHKADLLELTVRAIRFNCIKHEGNRQDFINLNLINLLSELLTRHKAIPTLVKEICACLRSLTLDDDIRVPFGKAHENAKMIVTDGDALKAILTLCEEYPDNSGVLAELFLTLSCLTVRNEFCKEVMDRGGLKLILAAFQNTMSDKTIIRQVLVVLKSLAGNDEVKSEIAHLGGVELIAAAMLKHQTNTSVATAACRVLSAITLRNMDNCKKVMECQGHQLIVQAMKLHPNDPQVQKQACSALRNLVSRCKNYADDILALGTESLLNTAMNQHKDARDEAKAALRDLGCKVHLTELWRGENGILPQDTSDGVACSN